MIDLLMSSSAAFKVNVVMSLQKPGEEEVVRKQAQRERRPWGLPPPPTAEFSQWSGSAEADERRSWQPAEPPSGSWQEVCSLCPR